MKWAVSGRARWLMLTSLILGLIALLAACGGGSNTVSTPANANTAAQTAVATVIGGQGATVVAGVTAAASVVSQIQTAAPGINATVTAITTQATALASSIPVAAGSASTIAASTAFIPPVPAATFVTGIQTAASSTNPTVRILAPVPNSSIPGSAGIGVSYLVTNVNLPLTADASTPITGTHIAVILDDTVKAGQAVPNDGTHIQTMGRTALLKNVTPGQHTIHVVVVDEKNVPLPNAEAQAAVTFTAT